MSAEATVIVALCGRPPRCSMLPARTQSCSRWAALAAPWPALVIGALLMDHEGVAASIWKQNLLAGTLGIFLCIGVGLAAPPPLKRSWRWVTAIFSIGLLLVTFADEGQAEVHRWVQAGPFRLHAGAIVLPALIILLGDGLAAPKHNLAGRVVSPVACGVLSLLAAQPDAAQATAFAGALLTVLVLTRQSLAVTCSAAVVAVMCIAWVWTHPDPLSPVRYVEGVIGLAAERGVAWLMGALLSLALLPWPFLSARWENGKVLVVATALGVYFLLNVFAGLIATFPVPLLGYGFSPIAGYFIALAWLLTAHQPERVSTRVPPPPLDDTL